MSLSLTIKIACLLLAAVYLVQGDGGHSSAYRKQDDHGKYSFGYSIKDKKGATNFRKETGDGWNVKGSYGLHDGWNTRVVHYVADKHGYRAVIKTNEPGTGNMDAANAIYNGPDQHGHSDIEVHTGSHGGHHKEDHWGGHHEKHHDHKGWGHEDKHHDKHEKHEDHWNKKEDHWNSKH